jgi:hypothetical protein
MDADTPPTASGAGSRALTEAVTDCIKRRHSLRRRRAAGIAAVERVRRRQEELLEALRQE